MAQMMLRNNFPQPYYKDEYCMLYKGNALEVLRQFPNDSMSCVVTSPPFFQLRAFDDETVVTWDGDENCEHEFGEDIVIAQSGGKNDMRDSIKGSHFQSKSAFCIKCGAWRGQLGNEPNVSLFMLHLLSIFAEVKRVLRPDGTVWVEINDTYGNSGGSDEKSLLCVPFRFATGMTELGYLLRNTIIIWKRSCVPCSAMDRLTVDHSYLFFFTKSRDYWFQQQFEPARDQESYAGRRPRNPSKFHKFHGHLDKQSRVGKTYPLRNQRTVWDVTQKGLREDHYAPFSETLVEIPISAGSPEFICNVCNRPRKLVVEKEYLVAHERHGEKYQKLVNLTWGPIMAGFNVSDVYYDDCDCVADDKWRPGIILDPFCGTSTTGVVAIRQRKFYVGIDPVQRYLDISLKRIAQVNLSQKTQDSITENNPLQRMLF